MLIKAVGSASNHILYPDEIRKTLIQGLGHQFVGESCLVLIPDHTRSLPLPELFRMLVEILAETSQLDFMVALGTHPGLTDKQLNQLVGISDEERRTTYRHIQLLNHHWMNPENLVSVGVMADDEIRTIAGEKWHESLPSKIDIRINKAIFEYDHLIILGPTFPHEVVGYSGGAKYLFPGISGPEMINATHWLGALSSVVGTIGIKNTPVREMIHAAARRLNVDITLVALVVEGHDLAGIFVGDLYQAWEAAADFSSTRHIRWVDRPFQRVLSRAPAMYDELWTAAKATYKLEPAIAHGGEVIIYAPHLDTVSLVHGKFIYEAGYHILPYFLENWEKYQHIPLGVLAHCTHLRGSGRMENGIEKPNIRVTLSSKISEADCRQLNLGYLDPAQVRIEDWIGREDEGILYVSKAGEILYKTLIPGIN